MFGAGPEVYGGRGGVGSIMGGVAVMTTPIFLSENDLHTMLRIVNAPDLGDDGEGLPWSTLEGLKALIPCAVLDFDGIDVEHRRYYFEQNLGEPGYLPGHAEVYWALYPDSSCSYPERTGDFRSVTMTTDFCTLRENRRTPMYIDFSGPLDIDHSMRVCMPNGPGRQLRLLIHRGRADPEFSERDRALLILLRPHLHAAHLQVLRRRLGISELTKRQWQLLRLVDAGLSNTQIARRLQVTENTVRKHLENIFERLQVTSRTAALARAFPGRALV
jgi:DNA-binding CsgD family transcriptional regulator